MPLSPVQSRPSPSVHVSSSSRWWLWKKLIVWPSCRRQSAYFTSPRYSTGSIHGPAAEPLHATHPHLSRELRRLESLDTSEDFSPSPPEPPNMPPKNPPPVALFEFALFEEEELALADGPRHCARASKSAAAALYPLDFFGLAGALSTSLKSHHGARSSPHHPALQTGCSSALNHCRSLCTSIVIAQLLTPPHPLSFAFCSWFRNSLPFHAHRLRLLVIRRDRSTRSGCGC